MRFSFTRGIFGTLILVNFLFLTTFPPNEASARINKLIKNQPFGLKPIQNPSVLCILVTNGSFQTVKFGLAGL